MNVRAVAVPVPRFVRRDFGDAAAQFAAMTFVETLRRYIALLPFTNVAS